MKSATLFANWDPKEDFSLGPRDAEGKRTYSGSRVWRNPRLEIVDKPEPHITRATDVIIEVKACGVCGSDVHMAEQDSDGYISYPGLTAFPCTLGHEFAGIVVAGGRRALDKRTGNPFRIGEPVTCEEMVWCGECRPCAAGYLNHCERLEEIGFSRDGALAQYIKVQSKLVWSLHPLAERYYDKERVFLAGSLCEPASVAHNAIVTCAGGIRPGENAVVIGGGPIGLLSCVLLKRAGAGRVILSEPSQDRRTLAYAMGNPHTINPTDGAIAEQILDLTDGMGASLYVEASGQAHAVLPAIEESIARGKIVGSKVVLIGRAEKRVVINPEVLQTRRASIIGAQGHAGYNTFPNVIAMMAAGMNVLPIITKTIALQGVSQALKDLKDAKEEGKVTVLL